MGPQKEVKSRRRRILNQPAKFGQKERTLVLFLVIITVATSAYLGAKARGWKVPKPNLTSTIILKANTIKKPDPQTVLEEKVKDLTGDYGIYVYDLKTGQSYGTLQNEKFEGASFFKLPLMIAAYEQSEAGQLDLSQYKDLLASMGKHSDNSAFVSMLSVVGMPKVQEVLNQIGMQNTSYTDSTTTPYDIGLLFQKLQNGELISAASRDELLSFMTDTDYEYLITKGVPEDIVVSHKYGKADGVINDAGIVFASKPYIVVIMSQEVDEVEATTAIPQISQTIFDLQTKQN